MKTKKLLTLYLLTSIAFTACASDYKFEKTITSTSDTLKIATYNVRIETTGDKDERSWDNRKEQVAHLIYEHSFDVFGVQEIINTSQEKDLVRLLPAFDHISRGRGDNEGKKGERLGIFFNKKRFSLLTKGSFFLSETPDQVSKGWDAALNRICLWVKLQDKITGKSFYFFNVHFDHMGVIARTESARLVTSKIKEITGNEIVFCVGDFNASPAEPAVYNAMTTLLTDSRTTSETTPSGTVGTFNGWDVAATDFDWKLKIDYIFTKQVRTLSYEVINDKYVSTTYPSDHFPIMINCLLQ